MNGKIHQNTKGEREILLQSYTYDPLSTIRAIPYLLYQYEWENPPEYKG